MAAPPGDPPAQPDSRLARRLTLSDAVVVGLGSMIGAGVFAAVGPAARAAGNGLVLAFALAAVVAYCNALSSAQLAALHPESGGTYAYGRRRLGPLWGFLAGWGFVLGKMASCTAMALTFGRYVWPAHERPLAVAAVLILTSVNYFGVKKTALATRAIVCVVLGTLAVLVAATLGGGAADGSRLWPIEVPSGRGLLEAAGLLFFAFAGYARIATLGEEVVHPARTIPRAIVIALSLTLLVYLVVAVAALAAIGPEGLAGAAAPLAAAAEAGRWPAAAGLVRVGAAAASLGVLLSLIAGISRTMFAMAAEGDLPRGLAAVHPRYRVPHRAELVVGGIVAAAVALTDLRTAIGFSSFTVLGYYAITNAAALRLGPAERRFPPAVAVLGLLGCATLAVNLPAASSIPGAVLLALGALVFLARGRRRGEG